MTSPVPSLRDDLEVAVAALQQISLEQLDEQAALRTRVDTKYVLPISRLATTIERLAARYRVLEIEGLRSFEYESVYLDTPELRCFHDHVQGREPRFKARSRLYRETRACFFEVKVSEAGGTTRKRQAPYDPADHGAITPDAAAFLQEVLRDAGVEAPPDDLAAALSTRYRRITLAEREGGARVTVDLGVQLMAMDGREVVLHGDQALVETKSEEGGGPFDEALLREGCRPTSVSKYRLGAGLLLAEDPWGAGHAELRAKFG